MIKKGNKKADFFKAGFLLITIIREKTSKLKI